MSDSNRVNLVSPTKYPWAYNQIKLNQAYSALVQKKNLDSHVVINEESVKEEYIARKGLLAIDQKKVIEKKRPKSTSNIDR